MKWYLNDNANEKTLGTIVTGREIDEKEALEILHAAGSAADVESADGLELARKEQVHYSEFSAHAWYNSNRYDAYYSGGDGIITYTREDANESIWNFKKLSKKEVEKIEDFDPDPYNDMRTHEFLSEIYENAEEIGWDEYNKFFRVAYDKESRYKYHINGHGRAFSTLLEAITHAAAESGEWIEPGDSVSVAAGQAPNGKIVWYAEIGENYDLAVCKWETDETGAQMLESIERGIDADEIASVEIETEDE